MICPKCGFEQPESPECVRCGIIVSRYRGPALGADALRPPASPPSPPSVGTVYGEPAAAMAGATGTIYSGPAPAAGGTVYGGPPPGAPVAPAFSAFRGGTISVGAILSEAFSIYFANFLPFVLLTVIALSPLYLLEGYMVSTRGGGGDPSTLLFLSLGVLLLSALLCPNIATAAITYGVFQQMRGKDATIGECLRWGLALLLPVLGLAVIQGFLVGLATLACLIPGIYLATRWAVSIPAAVTERCGVFEAMNRSTFLTEDQRWEVFGVLFVLGILNVGGTLAIRKLTAGEPSLALLVMGVKDTLTVGISATASAVLYYRLRDAKETIDVDQIASVFS